MTVIELFAGAGGAALGLSRAGFQHLALCEWDPAACATLRAAGHDHVLEGDLRALHWTGWPSPDLVWASPPCQAWSSAGRREGARDERNGWPWTWEAVDALQPNWFVAENVPGLLHHLQTCGDTDTCSGCYWDHVILPAARRRFEWIGVWLLNAADYGVPQHRRRVFLVAGPGPVAAPTPTHADPAELRQGSLFEARRPWRTVREAIESSSTPPLRVFGIKAAQERGGKAGMYAICGAGLAGQGRPRDSGLPAPSIGASSSPCVADLDLRQFRRLTPEECAALQAFPPDYPFQGGKTARYRQIGNAVPPPLAEAVGKAVLAADRRIP